MKNSGKKNFLLITIFLSIVFMAEGSYPLVTNFNRKAFGGGAQTWSIVQDSVGRMYFGNSNGLVTFNSREWGLQGLPNGSTVRSLLLSKSHPGRLYTGGSEEFGYYEYDLKSKQNKYHSLVGKITPRLYSFKEVWAIHEAGKDVWFRADNKLFHYDGKKITHISVPEKISASAIIGKEFVIAVEGYGVYKVQAGRLKYVETSRLLANNKVTALLSINQGIMIVTERNGLWNLVADNITRIPTDIDSFLIGNQIFCAACQDSKVAFGTVGNGVVIKDFSTGNISYANIDTGTQNNTILSMYFDRDGDLWLGLDNGIDLLRVNSPFSNLLGSSTVCGAGYCSRLLDNILYLGTNQGLYQTTYPISTSPICPVPKLVHNSQIWNLEVLDGMLFVCSDNGLSIGKNGVFTKLEGIPGAWDVHALKKHPGYALVSTYNGFFLLENASGRWINKGRVEGYSDIGGQFMEDDKGDIWISHWLKGIYQLSIDPRQCKVTQTNFYNENNGLPSNRNCAITKIGGQYYFTTESGLYTLGSDKRFKKQEKLNKGLSLRTASRVHESPNGNLWIVNGDGVRLATRNGAGNFFVDSITYSGLADQLIPGFDDFNFINDSHVIVSNRDGFYELDLNYHRQSSPESQLLFNFVYADGDSVLYSGGISPKETPIELDYGHNSLRFEYILPEYRAENAVMYSCYLENYDSDWSGYTATPSKEYTQLMEGRYKFHVRALNQVTHEEVESTLEFKILPPWYRTTVAKVIYSILILGIIAFLYRMAISMAQKETKRLARKKEEELEIMKREAREEALQKDYEIAELKGRQLEQDVKHKTEELSNITMNVVRKNEILLDISSHLTRLSQSPLPGEVTPQIEHIQQLIKQNISHDDDWRSFVHNFDAAYEDFTRKLIEHHPTLTRTELRVSCYIRMGLSSKDIAPLFNISHRSVEMTRYRLRKKLNLPREVNLTEYLQGIS